jgi:hypothetical protein
MPKFRKKPIVIEALQFAGGIDSAREIQDWAKKYELYIVWFVNYDSLSIDTLEGTMSAEPGDWVIRGVKDEFYSCKPDIFEATYELVDEPWACMCCGEPSERPVCDDCGGLPVEDEQKNEKR